MTADLFKEITGGGSIPDPFQEEELVIDIPGADPLQPFYDHFKEKEGTSLVRYYDSKGIPTVGVGWNLQRKDSRKVFKGMGIDYDAVASGRGSLTTPQSDQLHQFAVAEGLTTVKKYIPDYDNLDLARRIAIADMASNMGETSFRGFPKMIAAINQQDWKTAAYEALHNSAGGPSEYSKDVPGRARANATALLTGLTTEKQQQQLRQSNRAAKQNDPDAVVKAQEVGVKAGVDPNVALRRPDETQQQADDRMFTEITGSNPGTTEFLEDPDNMAKAHDDVDNLRTFEDKVREVSFSGSFSKGIDIMQRLGWRMAEAIGETGLSDDLAEVGKEGAAFNTEQIEASTAGSMSFTEAWEAGTASAFFDWMVATGGEQVPLMAPSLAGAAVGAAAGLIVPIIGPAVGAIIGAFIPNLVLGVGEVQQGVKERGGEDATASLAVFGGGALIAAFDSVLPGRVMGSIRKTFGKEGTEFVLKRITAKVAAAGAKGAGVEAITEGIQEAIGEAAAAYGTDTAFAEEGAEAMARQIIDAMAAGALMGGSVTTTHEGLGQLNKSRKTKKQLDEANAAAISSRLRGRDPAAFKSFADSVMEKAGIQQVEIDAQAVVEYAESTPDPTATMDGLGIDLADETTQTILDTEFGKFTIPASNFAEGVLGTEGYQQLANSISIAPGTESVNEAIRELAGLGEAMELIVKDIKDGVSEDISPMTDYTRDKVLSLIRDIQKPETAAEAMGKTTSDIEAVLAELVQRVRDERVSFSEVQTRGRITRVEQKLTSIEQQLAGNPRPAQVERLERERDKLEEEQAQLTRGVRPGLSDTPGSEALRTVDPAANQDVAVAEEELSAAKVHQGDVREDLASAQMAELHGEVDTEPAAAFEDKDAEAAKGTGEETRAFFEAAARGEKAPTTGKEYAPVLDTGDATEFADAMGPFPEPDTGLDPTTRRGHFDIHISTSIPGYAELMPMVGHAIVESVGEGAMLDIGGSEGAMAKTVTELSKGAITTEVLDPNPTMHQSFDAKPQVPGATFLEEAFSNDADLDGSVAFTEEGKRDETVAALEEKVGVTREEVWDALKKHGEPITIDEVFGLEQAHILVFSDGSMVNLPTGHAPAMLGAIQDLGVEDSTEFFDLAGVVPGSPIQINTFIDLAGKNVGGKRASAGVIGVLEEGRTGPQKATIADLATSFNKIEPSAFVDGESMMVGKPDQPATDIVNAQLEEDSYAVVFESMVFQFIGNDRVEQIKRVAGLLAEDGIAIFQEKFTATEADLAQWEELEAQKDAFKLQYYDKDTITEKAKSILEGMNRFSVTPQKMEEVLREHFDYVTQHWVSGNFKGYVATNDRSRMTAFLEALPPTDSEFTPSTVSTPRTVASRPTLEDLQPGNIEELVGRSDIAFISGTREADLSHSVRDNNALREALRARGIEFYETGGSFSGVEQSGFVVFMTSREALLLGKQMGQTEVLTGDAMLSADGGVAPVTGIEEVEESFKGDHTVIHATGARFAMSIGKKQPNAQAAAEAETRRQKRRMTTANAAVRQAETTLGLAEKAILTPRNKEISLRARMLDRLEVDTNKATIRATRRALREGIRLARTNLKEAITGMSDIIRQTKEVPITRGPNKGQTRTVMLLDKDRQAKYIRKLGAIKENDPTTDIEKALNKIRAEVLADLNAQRVAGLKKAIKKRLKAVLVNRTKASPRGLLDARTQEIVDSLYLISKMDKDLAQAKLFGILDTMQTKGSEYVPTTQQKLEVLMLQAQANPREASANQLEELLVEIDNLIAEGKEIRAEGELARKRRADTLRSDLMEALGDHRAKKRGLVGRRVIEGMEAGLYALNATWANKLRRVMQTNDRALAEGVIDRLSLTGESREFEAGKETQVRVLFDKLQTVLGLTERQLRKKMNEDMTDKINLGSFKHADRVDAEGRVLEEGVTQEIEMTRSELHQAVMELRNEDVRNSSMHPNGSAYTPAIIEAMEQAVSSEADMQIMGTIMDYYSDYYERVAPAYEAMYGVPLPHIEVYVPIRRHFGDTDTDELMRSIQYLGGSGPGSLKSRTPSIKPLKVSAAWSRVHSHIEEMEYFIAYSQKVRLIDDVFEGDNAKVMSRIRRNYGKLFESTIQRDRQYFAKRGALQSVTGEAWWGALLRKFSFAQLGGKAQIGFKQLASFTAYSEDVRSDQFVAGLLAFAANPRKALRFLDENSALFRQRGMNIDADFTDLVRDVNSFLGRRPTLTKIIMLPIRFGDRGAIAIGGYAHIQAQMKRGKTQAEAVQSFEKLTAATQQSTDPDQLSEMQRHSAFMRVLTQFMSSANALMRAEYGAMVEVAKGRITKKEFLKRFITYHFIIPNTIMFIANGFDWDDEDQLKASILGSFNGVFVLGSLLEALSATLAGSDTVHGLEIRHPLHMMEELLNAVRAYDEQDLSWEEFVDGNKFIDRTARGLAAIHGVPYATILNGLRGLAGGGADASPGDAFKLMLGYSPYIIKKNRDPRFKPITGGFD